MGQQPSVPMGTTVHQWGCDYIRTKYRKPGKVFLGIVSRLDKPTTGVMVLARTSKSASRLSAQFAAKQDTAVEKIYRAVLMYSAASAGSGPRDDEFQDGLWSDWMIKDESAKQMRCVAKGTAKSKLAISEVRTIRHEGNLREVEVRLITGRKHQIRVQTARRGFPVVGEFKYSADRPGGRLLLHSHQLTIQHPTKREPITFTSRPWWE